MTPTSITANVYICHRFATHWTGGYSKADFDRAIAPLLSQHNAILAWKLREMSRYEVTFSTPTEATNFRTELTKRIKLLHYKATYGWKIKEPA